MNRRKFLLTILLIFLVLITSLSLLILFDKFQKESILNNKNIAWGLGWKNHETIYSGSELRFDVKNTKKIIIKYHNLTTADQGIEINVDNKIKFASSTAYTKNTLQIDIDRNKKHSVTIKYFCIYLYDPCHLQLDDISTNKSSIISLPSNSKKVVSVIGDSISTVYGRNNYIFLSSKRLNYELHNASVLGATLSKVSGVDNVLNRYKKDLKDFKSDILIVSIGSNDAVYNVNLDEFSKNYRQLLNDIRSWNPGLKIILEEILPRKDVSEPSLKQYNAVIKDLANEYQIYFLDTSNWLSYADYSDAVHPSINAQGKMEEKLNEFLLPIIKN